MTAFTTGPVYVFAVRVLGSQSSWEDPWIRLAFIGAAIGGSAVWLSVALDRRLKRLDIGLILAGIFTALAVLSTWWSILPHQTLWRSLVYCGMLATAWCLASMELSRFSSFMLCLTGFGVVASILVRLVRPEVGLDGSGIWRGIYTNPNSLGPICALFMITLLTMALQNSDLRIRILSIVGMIVAAVPLIGSTSETAMGALVASVAVGAFVISVAMLWKHGRREWSIALGVIGIAAAAAIVALLTPWITSTTGIQQRTEVWRVVWDRIWIKPLGGYGFFTYWDTGASMSPRALARAGSAHNSALEASLDLGASGFILVVALAATALARSIRDALTQPCARTLYWLMLAVFVVSSHLTESFVSWFSYVWVLLVVLASTHALGDDRT
jgi:O-antigen ligase